MVTAQKIRVLIVDDHVMVRQGLRAVLQSYPNIDVVGEAGNGEEALSSVAKLQPTIVVMDISMPSLDGIGATRLIKLNTHRSRCSGYRSTPRAIMSMRC